MAAHLSAEPAYRAAFLREGEVAAEVSHPHVVPVHAAGEEGGLLYLAMAWIDGPDLRRLATAGGLSAARIVSLVSQVARALDALHEAGIVHGDVKPSNVLVHREDHAYLVDFGVARRSAFADPTTGELLGGTPAFAAPETARGLPDPASDQYSLGCVTFELLTGLRPFGTGDPQVLESRHANSPRPRVSDVTPELASFDDVVARAMARDPAERYPSGAAFARALAGAERAVQEPATLIMPPLLPTRDPNPATRRRARGPRARIPATGRALGPPGRVSSAPPFRPRRAQPTPAVPRRVLAQRHPQPHGRPASPRPRRRQPRRRRRAARRAPARASRASRSSRSRPRRPPASPRSRSRRAATIAPSVSGRPTSAWSHGCSRTTPTRSTAATSTCWPGRSQRASCVGAPMASRATA